MAHGELQERCAWLEQQAAAWEGMAAGAQREAEAAEDAVTELREEQGHLLRQHCALQDALDGARAQVGLGLGLGFCVSVCSSQRIAAEQSVGGGGDVHC